MTMTVFESVACAVAAKAVSDEFYRMLGGDPSWPEAPEPNEGDYAIGAAVVYALKKAGYLAVDEENKTEASDEELVVKLPRLCGSRLSAYNLIDGLGYIEGKTVVLDGREVTSFPDSYIHELVLTVLRRGADLETRNVDQVPGLTNSIIRNIGIVTVSILGDEEKTITAPVDEEDE